MNGKIFFEYKEIPQYILLNSNMTLDEFKLFFFGNIIIDYLADL